MRKPFRAQSTVSYQIRDGLMAMCLLVTVVRLLSRGTAYFLGVVQSGRTLALGASGRRFKSCRRDHMRELCIKVVNNGVSSCIPLEPFRI